MPLSERDESPRPLAALALYAALAVAVTWPLAAHLTDRLPAGANDLWQNYWNFWWWKTSLLERGASPYRTDLIYQPGDVSLAFHTHSEASILSALPVLAALGPAAALNTAVLLSFALAGWGAYLLARELVKDARAAFVAGIVFAVFPHRVEQTFEHLNLASCQAMPFFLLFLVRLARDGGMKNAALAGAAYAVNCLYSWHNGLLVVLLACALLAWEAVKGTRPRLAIARDTAIAAAVAVLAMLPFAWPMLSRILAGDTSYLKPPPLVPKGVDALFFLIPAEGHPLFGPLVRGLYESLRGYASAGFTCYAGLSVLALGVWALARRAPATAPAPGGSAGPFPVRLWGCLFLLHAALALGSTLVIAGQDTGLPMPFRIVLATPALKTIRLANRLVAPAMLALSVLAAAGAARILACRGRAAFATLAGVVLLDLLWVPYPLRDLPRPAWIDAVRAAPPGLVLDLPGGHRARGAEDMYFQTLHGRPTVGGYVSAVPERMEKRVSDFPILKLFFEGRAESKLDVAAIDVERELRRTLDALPVSTVIVHLDRKREGLEEQRSRHRGDDRERLYNPEKGTPGALVDRAAAAMRSMWGEPVHAGADALVFTRTAK